MNHDVILKELENLEKLTSTNSHMHGSGSVLWWNSKLDVSKSYDDFLVHRMNQVDNIRDILKKLIDKGELKENFKLLDMCAAEGSRGCLLKKTFPKSMFYAFDITRYSAEKEVKKNGVNWFSIDLEKLLNSSVEFNFDVILMINSYRGLLDTDKDNRRGRLNKFIKRNSKFFMFTQTAQIQSIPGQVSISNRKSTNSRMNEEYNHVESIINPKTMTLHCYKIKNIGGK